MHYQMWHAETRNLMDDFDTEAEALEAVRAYLTPDENGVAVDVFLIVYGDGAAPDRAVDGEELARLAFGPSNERGRRSA